MKNTKFNISANSKLTWGTGRCFLEQELKESRKNPKTWKPEGIIKLEDIFTNLETIMLK